MRIPLLAAALSGACVAAIAAAPNKGPEFHPLRVPAGKSAADLKPKVARADDPIILELKAHRRADGSLELQCDHHDHHDHALDHPGVQAGDSR